MMTVTITAADNPYQNRVGGKHVHQLLLEQGLRELGLNVLTLYPSISIDPKAKRYLDYSIGILKSGDLAYPYTFRLNTLIKKLIDLYKARKVELKSSDIIHSHDVVSMYSLIRVEKHLDVPKILTIHGYFAKEFVDYNIIPSFLEEKVYRMAFEIEEDAINYADFIIAVDSRIKEYLISTFSFPKNKIKVLPNAIDTKRFSPVTSRVQKILKRELGFSPYEFLLLVPRRLVPKNGVIYAVRAMEYIQREDIKLIILGEGIERKNIESEIKKKHLENKIILLGLVPHDMIHKYFKAADVVLIPSVTSHGVQEATSLAALEGMSCGKPVIATSIGGLKEIIKNETTGLLVPERDPKAIADAIVSLIENRELSSQIGLNARNYVLQHHSYIQYSNNILRIYNNLLGEH